MLEQLFFPKSIALRIFKDWDSDDQTSSGILAAWPTAASPPPFTHLYSSPKSVNLYQLLRKGNGTQSNSYIILVPTANRKGIFWKPHAVCLKPLRIMKPTATGSIGHPCTGMLNSYVSTYGVTLNRLVRTTLLFFLVCFSFLEHFQKITIYFLLFKPAQLFIRVQV